MQINPLILTPTPNPIWLIVKIFFIVGLVTYSIFAFVVVRQTQVMTNTVKLHLEMFIKLLALIHFAFAILLLLFAIFAL